MTRLGENSRIVFTGDLVQTDLHNDRKRSSDVSGMQDFMRVIERMSEFELVKFNKHDIVRSALVKSWIVACEEMM
jgi:phosphate starvation-inducible protein PhoH